MIAELDTSRNYKKFYIPGEGEINKATGERKWYSFDRQGSVVHTVSEQGYILEWLYYDAYGNRIFQTGSPGPFRYNGKSGYFHDKDVDMDLLQARYYIPMIGRFMQADPIGQAGGLNTYAYCGNNPFTGVDPTGLDRELAMNRISSNAKSIVSVAKTYGIPAGLLATVIWNEAGGFSTNVGGRQAVEFAQGPQDINAYMYQGRASLGIVQMTKIATAPGWNLIARRSVAEAYIKNVPLQLADAAQHLIRNAKTIYGNKMDWDDEDMCSRVLQYYNWDITNDESIRAGYPIKSYGNAYRTVRDIVRPTLFPKQ